MFVPWSICAETCPASTGGATKNVYRSESLSLSLFLSFSLSLSLSFLSSLSRSLSVSPFPHTPSSASLARLHDMMLKDTNVKGTSCKLLFECQGDALKLLRMARQTLCSSYIFGLYMVRQAGIFVPVGAVRCGCAIMGVFRAAATHPCARGVDVAATFVLFFLAFLLSKEWEAGTSLKEVFEDLQHLLESRTEQLSHIIEVGAAALPCSCRPRRHPGLRKSTEWHTRLLTPAAPLANSFCCPAPAGNQIRKASSPAPGMPSMKPRSTRTGFG